LAVTFIFSQSIPQEFSSHCILVFNCNQWENIGILIEVILLNWLWLHPLLHHTAVQTSGANLHNIAGDIIAWSFWSIISS
jgi:hypothetical protein